jgi:hypothetical protein
VFVAQEIAAYTLHDKVEEAAQKVAAEESNLLFTESLLRQAHSVETMMSMPLCSGCTPR